MRAAFVCNLHGPLSLLMLPVAAGAQHLPPLDEYLVRTFGVEHGLPVAEVRDIEQPGDGYLYAATARGLVRFDGAGFEYIDLAPLESPILDALHTDRLGRLWILTGDLALGYLDDAIRFRLVERPDSSRVSAAPRIVRNGTSYRDFSETPDGALWIGGWDGLTRVDPKRPERVTRFRITDGLPSDTTAGVYALASRELVAVTGRGLARVTPGATSDDADLSFELLGRSWEGRFVVPADVWHDSIGLVVRVQEGMLRYSAGASRWLDDPGRSSFDADSLVWRPGTSGALPRGLELLGEKVVGGRALVQRDGTVWISRWPVAGAPLLRGRAGEFTEVQLSLGGDTPRVRAVLEDHEGSVWLATDRGLVQFVQRRVAGLAQPSSLEDAFTTAILQTRDGSIWVGSWGRGLFRIRDGQIVRRYTENDGIPLDRVRALHEADDGTLWVGGPRGGLAIEDGEPVWRFSAPDEVRDFETVHGVLWMATATSIHRRSAAGWTDVDVTLPGLRGIWDLYADADGTLWVAAEGGVYRISNGRVEGLGPHDGAGSDFFVAVHEDGRGVLWFSSYDAGLHRLDGDRLIPIGSSQGLHHDGIWSMVPDASGAIWMSSDGGIARVTLDALHATADAVGSGQGPDDPITAVVLDSSDGAVHPEANRASPAAWRLESGRILFNSRAGIAVVDPVRAMAPVPPSRVVIDSVRVDGRAPDEGSRGFELGVSPRHVEFHFTALAFAFPDETRYRFRLDGYDDDWVGEGTRRVASYTNLPHGRYIFRVQSTSEGVRWSSDETELAILILPSLWQRLWFQLLLAVALLAMLAAAHRLRVARAVAMERLRMRIASDLHDDVGSSLSAIALLSEMLSDRDRIGDYERRQLARLREAAERSVESLRDAIWVIDPAHDQLQDLIRRMRRLASESLYGIEYVLAAPRDLDRRVSVTFMRNVLLVYKEALHNAERHAGARRIRIDVTVDGNDFRLRIRDDGRGFEPEGGGTGRGLESLKRRAEDLRGELLIRSSRGGGTEIQLDCEMA